MKLSLPKISLGKLVEVQWNLLHQWDLLFGKLIQLCSHILWQYWFFPVTIHNSVSFISKANGENMPLMNYYLFVNYFDYLNSKFLISISYTWKQKSVSRKFRSNQKSVGDFGNLKSLNLDDFPYLFKCDFSLLEN